MLGFKARRRYKIQDTRYKMYGLNADLLEDSTSRKVKPTSHKGRTKIIIPICHRKSKARKQLGCLPNFACLGSQTSLSSASIGNACMHLESEDVPDVGISETETEIQLLREEVDKWKKIVADLEQKLREKRMVREQLLDENEELKKKDNDNRDLIMLQNKTILTLEETLINANDENTKLKRNNEENMNKITKLTFEKMKLQRQNKQKKREMREMKNAKPVNIYQFGNAREVYVSSSNKRIMKVIRNGSFGSGSSSGKSKVNTTTKSSTELKEEKVRATEEWVKDSTNFSRDISPQSTEMMMSQVESNSHSSNDGQQTTVEPEAMAIDDANWNDLMNLDKQLEFAHAQLDDMDEVEESKSTSRSVMTNVVVGEPDTAGQMSLSEGNPGHAGPRRTINLGATYTAFSKMNLTSTDTHSVPKEFSDLIEDILTCIDPLDKLQPFLDMIEVPAKVKCSINTNHQMLLATCVEYTLKWGQRSVSDPSGTAPFSTFFSNLKKMLDS